MMDEQQNSEMEAVVTRALEQRPRVLVPEGFAARVAGSLPPLKPRRRPVQFGRRAGMVAAWVLALTIFALAPHAAPRFGNLMFDVELFLLVQLAVIVWWLGMRRET